LALAMSLVGGCGLENPQKVEAHQRWSRTRASVICGVGAEHLKVGDLDKARSRAAEALSLDEQCVPALVLMGKVLLGRGRYVSAEKHFRKAETFAPGQAEIPYLVGVALEKRGEYAEALKAYQKARALAPSNDAYVTASVEVLVSAGKPQLALELLEKRLERSDGEMSMLALAGELAMLVGDPGKSAEYYRRCLDVEPNHVAAREGLAKANFFLGDHAAALVDLQALAQHDGYKDQVSWLYIMIGDCHMAADRPAAAQEAYRTAARIDPGDERIWMALAKASLACGESAEAARAARQALALGEDDTEATMVLACAALDRGDGQGASRLMERVARKRPDDPTVLCMLGRCRAALGRDEEAAGYYVQALRADPDHRLAKRLLAATALREEPRR
jgi:tetratricopeptide (TPR) repeat protein